MTDSKTFSRIFSSSSASKYPTIGKLMPSSVVTQTVFKAPPVSSAPVSQPVNQSVNQPVDGDLELLDQLVSQTLLQRQAASQSIAPVSTRAKEFLPQQSQAAEVVSSDETAHASETVSAAETTPAVEVAPNAEMAELSKELQEVSKETKEQREQAAIAEKQKQISDLAAVASTPVAVSDKPVVVLPITEKSVEEAKFKSTKYSVKWLWEWCKKISKIFAGAVVYKEEIAD